MTEEYVITETPFTIDVIDIYLTNTKNMLIKMNILLDTHEINKDSIIIGKKIDDFRVLDYDHITTLSVSAIQELKKEVDDLKKENQTLKDILTSIMSRLDKANI